jgi:hypothetical protein
MKPIRSLHPWSLTSWPRDPDGRPLAALFTEYLKTEPCGRIDSRATPEEVAQWLDDAIEAAAAAGSPGLVLMLDPEEDQ